jgi:hypothetical protein
MHENTARHITDGRIGVTRLLHKPTLMVAAGRYHKVKAWVVVHLSMPCYGTVAIGRTTISGLN